jgi:hypothetical protein
MICFGIDNVRGGTYVDEVLPNYQTLALENEFTTAMNECKYIDEIHCMINNAEMYTNKSQIEAKKIQLQKDYDMYLNELQMMKKWQQVPPTILEDIDWLKNKIQEIK